MATRIDDRWLWLGFSVIFVLAATGIRHAVTDIVQLTRLDPKEDDKGQGKNDECPEDTISLANLRTLAESPNDNIANSAISLITSRIHRSPETVMSIRKDLRSEDQATRRLATVALDFLREYPLPPGEDGAALRSLDQSYGIRPLGHPRATSLDEEWHRQFGNRSGSGPTLGEENPWAIPEEAEEIVPSTENPVAGWTNVPRQRGPAGDAGEMARRRRREAMVLHEGDGELREEDIIRRL